MHRLVRLLPLGLLLLAPGFSRQIKDGCGTYRERLQEDVQLHQRTLRLRQARLGTAGAQGALAAPAAAAAPRPDAGDIAILEDGDGVISRRDDFNLNGKTLAFAPSDAAASRYKVSAGGASYDAAAASAGTLIAGLGDDDSALVPLPFPFPFFGASYRQVYINSDGNLTFIAAESASIERSIGRLAAGPPRIAPLFEDLDPTVSSNGVRLYSQSATPLAPGRFVVSWVAVPEYSDTGRGRAQTFQVRLYPDGRIEYAYSDVGAQTTAVVGIAPGSSSGATSVVSYLDPATASQEFTAAVAERFSAALELDTLSAAQRFYLNHEDSYDYLVIFNNEGVADSPGSIASTRVARTHWTGNGDTPTDAGAWFGSPSRLMAVINMAHLSQYPSNLTAPMSNRPEDTPLSILAHEAGHLFLAYASIPDPTALWGLPMLGGQAAHWSFNFNSEASLLEGNRIEDNGPSTTYRFRTTGSAQGYSPLDQYLMGFRASEDVPPFHPMFFVTGSPYANTHLPQTGLSFRGARRDVPLDELVAAVGRRTPDYTVAQRHFRFGFMLILRPGTQPSQAELDMLNNFRTAFESYYQTVSACGSCRWTAPQPTANTGLRRALRVTAFPNVGVLAGGKSRVVVRALTPVDSDLKINLSAPAGVASAPASVTIPAGSSSAAFELTGLTNGVEELVAAPADPRYETVYSRVQVSAGLAGLRLIVSSGGGQTGVPGVPMAQPVVLQVVDINNVPYPNVKVTATVTAGGSLTPASAIGDETGKVSFAWTPGPAGANRLTASIEGGSAAGNVTVQALTLPSFTRAGVVSAASFGPDISPGSFAAIFGANLWSGADADAPGLPWPTTLAAVQVLLDGQPMQITAVREGQVNFYIPQDRATGAARLVVSNAAGSSPAVDITLSPVAPAIFQDASRNGAVQVAWSGQWTNVRPARAGEYIEIYATGLGSVHLSSRGLEETDQPVSVFLGGRQVTDVPYSGLVPGYVGLYQVNARVPVDAVPGVQSLALEIAGQRSNTVNVVVQ